MNWMKYLLPVLALTRVEAANDVEAAFKKDGVIPDVIDDNMDLQFLQVTYKYYGYYYQVNLGNELKPIQTMSEPTVTWDADPNSYYTFYFGDPDVPSRTNRSYGEVNHWLVGNIPGNGDNQGQTLAEYFGAAPPKGQGLERYVFLLYEQPGIITYNETRIPVKDSGIQRIKFSIRDFAKRYYLGPPIAGNYYFAQYGPSVNETLLLVYNTTSAE